MALRDINIQAQLKGDLLAERLADVRDHMSALGQVIDMIQLKIKSESKQRFVKNYLGIISEGENVLKREVPGSCDEAAADLRIKAPFFNYVISQRNHRGELMTLSVNAMRSFQERRHSQGRPEPISKNVSSIHIQASETSRMIPQKQWVNDS